MKHIGLAVGDWNRSIAQEAQIPLLNRYYEQDPVPLDGQAALLARPALREWLTVGSGPIRGMFSQQGMFGNAVFVVSGTTLYKVAADETITALGTVAGTDYVPMCCTDQYVFLTNGVNLFYYTDNSVASNTLTITGTISAGEQVDIGGVYYQFTATSVDTGIPAGTGASPWLVALGASTSAALANLRDAIDNSGTPGTSYSSALTGHTQVRTTTLTGSTLGITSILAGSTYNSIVTTETLANGSWGAATLTGGGVTTFTTIAMPGGVGALWCDVINSFVMIVVSPGNDMNGRFYWLWPGSLVVNALDFATAERAPDQLYAVVTLGDNFWLFGASTTEIWYATGDGSAPFQRMQGRLFDRGVWNGSVVVKIGDNMYLADADGAVWKIGPTGVERISNVSIEERIREAMAAEIEAS